MSGTSSPSLFAGGVSFVESSPVSVATEDFNGDGKGDLATANYLNNTVSVLLGNGDGTFQTQTAYTTGSNPYSVTVGDFNGDGRSDLAATNSGSNTVSVLLNQLGYVVAGQLTLAATNASRTEGNSVGSQFTFIVTRTGDSNDSASVQFAVSGYGTHPADISDFGGAFPTGVVNFSAGETSKIVSIDVAGDRNVEDDEQFQVRLLNPSAGLFITQATAVGQILNDDVPPTELMLSNAAVSENLPVGTLVGQIRTLDTAFAGAFTYVLVRGSGDTGNSFFTISGDTILTNAAFDFETKTSYSIRVRAADQAGAFFDKVFIINVTNSNDAPTGITLSANSVVDKSPAGTVVGTLMAADPDAVDSITFALVSGVGDTDNGAFRLNGNRLKTSAVFDRATQTSFSIRVRAIDGAGLSHDEVFTIRVVDGFTLLSPTSRGTLPTGVTLIGGVVLDLIGTNGIRVVSQLAASQLFVGYFDSGAPSDYRGNPGTIGIQSGFTTNVVNALGGGLAEVAVRITLSDGDTGPSNFDDEQNVLRLNGISLGNFSSVVTQQRDADGVTVYFNNASGGFRDGTLDTGFFYSTAPQVLSDFFATLTTSRVIFQLSDVDPYDNCFDFTQGIDGGLIDVGQPPNLAPVATADNRATAVNTPVVIDLLANDSDGDGTLDPTSVTIASQPSHGSVTVNPVTGLVEFTPDSNYVGTDSFTYQVKDNAGADSNAALVTITVTSANNPPTDLALPNGYVLENSPLGTLVDYFGTADSDTNETFTYSLVSGDGDANNGSFTIDGNRLLTNAVFDFETKQYYSIRVRSTDSGGEFVEKTFTIGIMNTNEGAVAVAGIQSITLMHPDLLPPDSAGGGDFGQKPSVTADGRYVAFASYGNNLVPGDTNAAQDIFVRDLQSGTTTRINVGLNGEQANGQSNSPSISADGRFVIGNRNGHKRPQRWNSIRLNRRPASLVCLILE